MVPNYFTHATRMVVRFIFSCLNHVNYWNLATLTMATNVDTDACESLHPKANRCVLPM